MEPFESIGFQETNLREFTTRNTLYDFTNLVCIVASNSSRFCKIPICIRFVVVDEPWSNVDLLEGLFERFKEMVSVRNASIKALHIRTTISVWGRYLLELVEDVC